MTVIRQIKRWDDIPTGGVLVDAEKEREMSFERVIPKEPWKKPYIQIYDHNGFKLMKDYSQYIPYGLRIKFWVER